MKKVGIAVDDYKEEIFREELKKAGFEDFEVTDLKVGVKLFSIEVLSFQVPILGKLCKEIELKIKRSN